ncbi:hypothetical protein E4K67_22305 [Desulfosporosinus fructosivorans]|uniref:Uncharacterized protein n=1 Tax=Desulfosporosinus fructosivorans TaxID=2018669 RepID=A0A4Z0R0X0_9FIRM|nr:hypothetical protein [Desulfosporosinus fructosivorans]TGE35853.1 hypothetical protein E4K67_22305 [Desulfosporosinus fructosivorans]
MEIIIHPIESLSSMAIIFATLEFGSLIGLLNAFFGLILIFYIIGDFVKDILKRIMDWVAYAIISRSNPNKAIDQITLPKGSKLQFVMLLCTFFLLCIYMVGYFKGTI